MTQGSEDAGKKPVAVVTGAGIRVGRCIATALAGAGYRVWIHYLRSEAPARSLAAELGDAALGPIQADLSDETQRSHLAQTLRDPHGPSEGHVDLLVNNAASFERAPFRSRNDADLRRVLETNLIAPISLCRQLAPALERSTVAAGASIVNIVDLGALHPWDEYLDHCTAKAGLAMATRAMALELAPAIRVNGIAPGTVLWPTDAHHAEDSPEREKILKNIPMREIGTPENVADAVLFMAANRHLNGQILPIDGGRSANFGR